MGGVAKLVTRSTADILTGGAAEIGGFSKKAGDTVASGLGFGGGPTVPGAANQYDPKSILEQTGGAVLLSNITAGADIDEAMASFLGVSKADLPTYINTLDAADRASLQGVQNQLHQISTNTDLRNNAVSKLVNDYPNIMASSIQKYGAQADAAIQPMLDRAMQDISSKQSANGMLSSGASAAAAARAGTEAGYQRLSYATGLANQDFMQQLSEAEALRGFQQKMLGQGATQGFGAQQGALAASRAGAATHQEQQLQADMVPFEQQTALLGAVGQVGGMALGGYMQGRGAAAGAASAAKSGQPAPAANYAGSGGELE